MEEKKNFSWPVTSINREDYEQFCIWFEQNKNLLQQKQVVIWGAGIRGTEFAVFFRKKEFNNIVFVDSNAQKWGGCIDEFDIISPKELEKERETKNRIILISTENSIGIERELEEKKYCKNKDYFIIKTNLYEEYVKEFMRTYGQNLLIMGDCEFSTISIHDTDCRNLKEMLFEYCGKNNTKILAMHGMGLRAYYNIFHAQLINGMKPKCLMIMINFDTLTGKQHLLPRSQHSELLEALYEVMKVKEKAFEEYVNLTKERSNQIQMEFFTGREAKGGISESKCRNYFRLNYMYNLDITTEGIIYLLKILDEARKEGIHVIPFVPPVNYQLARQLFGEQFEQRYNSNLNKVKELVESQGFYLTDLSFCLEPDLFAEPKTADETANEKGRAKIAELLYKEIKRIN